MLNFRDIFVNVVNDEISGLLALKEGVDENFSIACNLLLECHGKVIVTGMGKSGHIGSKIAATLASTGTPSFFIHPGEASHGDLGMIETRDIVIALSNSGETAEVVKILPLLKKRGVTVIGVSGNSNSTLAKLSSVHLKVHVEKEACPLNLAPTTSTTAMLVLGDALAIGLLQAKNFSANDFAENHPGGSLGRRLLTTCGDLMRPINSCPVVCVTDTIKEIICRMTSMSCGGCVILDPNQNIYGICTDCDLRKIMEKTDDLSATIVSFIRQGCITVNKNCMAVDSIYQFNKNDTKVLVVTDDNNLPIGLLMKNDIKDFVL
jgi:arabinose-5-phosphate isomerase